MGDISIRGKNMKKTLLSLSFLTVAASIMVTAQSSDTAEIDSKIHELVNQERTLQAKLNAEELWGKPEGVEVQNELSDVQFEKGQLLAEKKKLEEESTDETSADKADETNLQSESSKKIPCKERS